MMGAMTGPISETGTAGGEEPPSTAAARVADDDAGSAAIARWAGEHGWFYAPTDSSTGVDAPQPMEARFDDFMLAHPRAGQGFSPGGPRPAQPTVTCIGAIVEELSDG